MREVTITGRDFTDMQQVHTMLAQELDFPTYYGQNLSALYDVLTETDQPARITVDLRAMEDTLMLQSLKRMLGVLEDVQEENPGIEVCRID